jgi:transcription elongation factor GreA
MAERLQHARELGDIRENAEYDAAKNEQGLMEARIRELERLLKNPDIMEGGTQTDAASPGVLVPRPAVRDRRDHQVLRGPRPLRTTTISAVDSYLEERIRGGRPIEALIATRRPGEIVNERSKEAARAATDGSWSWSDVGKALGMTKQAAHEKLRARVHDELAKGLSQLEKAEERGHAKIARRAKRGRDGLARVAAMSPNVDSARQRIDEWEEEQHAKLDCNLRKARDEIARAGESVAKKLDRKT